MGSTAGGDVASPTGELECWGGSPSEHVVQFYRTDGELIERVAGYLAGAIEQGDVAIVVATPAHRREVLARLTRAGVGVSEALASRGIRFLDAEETMRRFLVDDWPDAGGFESVIGGLVREAGAGGRSPRVFGEMVALLWDAGHVNAALELEDLWNKLGRKLPFSLFCAYPQQSVSSGDVNAFAHVCEAHSTVLPTAPPPTEAVPASKARAIIRRGTPARERILATAETLFARRGIHQVGVDELISSSGVAKATFYRHFPSKDALALAFLARRDQHWTRDLVEAGARRHGGTALERLLAIFDVFDEWFAHPDQFEGCSFINVLLEMGPAHSLGQASIGYLSGLRDIVRRWATEAGLSDVESFTRSWHILMTGAIISAAEGDITSARTAQKMGRHLAERHRTR